MQRLSLQPLLEREQMRGVGLPQRPAQTSPTTAALSAAHGPRDGLQPRRAPACGSASLSSSATGQPPAAPSGCLLTPTRRRATSRLPPPSSAAGDGGQSECCGSGRCGHRPAGSGKVGGRHWRLLPRELLVGAALAGPMYTAAASQAADGYTAAAAAAAAAVAEAAGAATTGGVDVTAAELAAAGVTSVVPPGYVPSPIEPGWEIWLGFVAGVVPFLIGSYEFGKRIIIQLRCEQCGGRGLVPSSGPGRDKYLRKCPQCGGFFPWISWKMFLTSAAAPGNGGPLQQPRGQTSVFYAVPDRPDPAKQAEALARSQGAIDALQARGRRAGQEQEHPSRGQAGVGGEGGVADADTAAAGGAKAASQPGQEVAEARAGAGGDSAV